MPTVGITEAARLLGISKDAVRKRIKRGTIEAHKVDNEWRVVVLEPEEETGQAQDKRQDTGEDGGEDAVQALIASLREQLDRKDQQISELHRMLWQEQQQVLALQEPPSRHERKQRESWWGRLFNWER